MVPHKLGMQEWWQDGKDRDLVLELSGLQPAEIAYIPGGMLKCLSGTANFGQLLKKGAK